MKKPNLISALAIAAVAAASLSLPATVSADSYRHEETKVVRHNHDANLRPVHNFDQRHSDSRGHGHTKWAPSRPRHDRGHHYGHRHQHGERYDYRPVERHQRHHNDDIRVRIFYDLHL